MPDIVEVIKEQHRQVDELLEEATHDGVDKAAILHEVHRMLLPHSEAEEDFVYPAIREKAAEAGEEIVDGTVEHHQVEEMMQNLLRSDPEKPGWDGTLAAIIGELRHHVEEEEEELLPILEKSFSTEEREAMGRRFVEATTGKLPEHHHTKSELYDLAREHDIPGRSGMSKDELAEAVGEA
ncbi:hemerythrin domain-containing protein [Actinoplanes sp. CA-015351]|uniref:hemerythrin domain-containing protein n=1 Tax=Actinoplanes sp. CA-015351 TaxID=3239897 RepID=UPI003D98887A